MPIDPSIIANSMSNIASNMPDVNALMQQRVQGAENIYKIEAARQAQAAEAEKEAAEAQEAATLKALLPAYTYGIQTGDMVGAGNLVPPEIRPQLQPYIDALSGKSPQEVQAALIGSLSSSSMGQEALAAIQRAQTAQIQLGQLDVSRGNLALERQKAALAARGDGEWELEPGVDEQGRSVYMWVNSRTRQVEPLRLGGGAPPAPAAAPGPTPIPAPDAVTPRAPAPGAPDVAPPAGAVQPPTFRPEPKKEDSLNEAEGKSYNFAIRMIDSDAVVNELEKEGVLTTDAVTDAVVGAFRALPTVAGGNLSEQIQNALNVVSPSLSPEEQRLAVAQLDFVTAVLRSESGAEIKTSEFPAEYRKYFPVEGDENNPKLLADKKRRRQNAIEGMKTRAGKSGRSQIEAYFAGEGAGAPPATVPAAPGATVDGFEYQGVEE